jgi:hypothetical protein
MMALLTSSPVTVSVTSFPYSLPISAGQVVFIGTNLPRDVRPPTHSVYNWEYACFGGYAGSAFIHDYSVGGALALAGTGGHGHPPNHGALLFDFADATWKRRDNSNGVGWTQQSDYPASHYSGGEFPGTTCPGPAHQYGHQWDIRTAQGGGSKGAFLCLSFDAMGIEGATGAGAHRMDLNTGFWTRASTNNPPTGVGGQGLAFYDPASNRYYVPQGRGLGGTSLLPYLDGNDWTWKGINHTPAPNYGDTFTTAGLIDLVRRMIVLWDTSSRLRAIDLDNLGAGYTTLSWTGSATLDYECTFVYYPPDGSFYHVRSFAAGMNSIARLTPPPFTGNKLAGTWTFSNVGLSATLRGAHPDYTPGDSGGAKHHNRLIYVPAIQRLAWLAGDTTVALIKPS